MPDKAANLRQFGPCLLAILVEKAQFHTIRNFRKDREIGSHSIVGRP
jgi:hypothetical protein